MTNIILVGCNGRMGKAITSIVSGNQDVQIACGVDIAVGSAAYPVYDSISKCTEKADVIVDFSSAQMLDDILSFSLQTGIPAVLCSTGYSKEQIAKISETAESIPVFRSANMSIGVNLISRLVSEAAEILGSDYDIEIIEKHHNKKKDAPSGTAIMLADSCCAGRHNNLEYVYDRTNVNKPRDKSELGISSIRGGTIVGEHDVIFAGENEVITISHSAQSREVFANGAIRAAVFMSNVKRPGLYTMQDVLVG